MRSIRTHEFLYIRNFRPERWPRGNPPAPEDLASMDRWSVQRPSEELYNIIEDPFCLANLAAGDAFAEVLAELRDTLDQELREQSDARALGYGDVYESFPRHMSFKPGLQGFKTRGEYNPEFLQDIPPEIFVSNLYYEALRRKQEQQK